MGDEERTGRREQSELLLETWPVAGGTARPWGEKGRAVGLAWRAAAAGCRGVQSGRLGTGMAAFELFLSVCFSHVFNSVSQSVTAGKMEMLSRNIFVSITLC